MIFEHGCYISALAHIRMLILSIYVLLECIKTIYKYGQFLGPGPQYLMFETCLEGIIWHFCSYLRHKQKLLVLSRLNDFMNCSVLF